MFMDEYCSTRGKGGMATFRKYRGAYKGGGFTISPKPVGIKRCWPAGFFPYHCGSDVQFDLGINCKGAEEVTFEWKLSRWDGNSALWVPRYEHHSDKLSPHERRKVVDLGTPFRPGQYSFAMRAGDDITKEMRYKLTVAFTIIDRDTLVLNLAQVLIGAIAGGIIGALITLIIVI